MVGKKPGRKPFGREGPPKGYPKNQSLYADPENWRYPLHTPWHAKAARRYFNDWPNRSKYTEDERAYIDWRINQAIEKFQTSTTQTKPIRSKLADKKPEELSLEELLELFLGPARLKRADEIGDSLVSIIEVGTHEIFGKVKEYTVKIDAKNRRILHDCQDWRNNLDSKRMCKHLGKFILTMNRKTAADLMADVLRNKDQWRFVAPETNSSGIATS